MAGETGGGGGFDLGGIYAKIEISTADVIGGLDRVHGGLVKASAATDTLKAKTAGLASASVADSERSLQAALRAMERRSQAADRAAAAESRAGLKAGQEAVGSFLVVEKASKKAADKEIFDSERSLQAALKAMNQRSAAAGRSAAAASQAGLNVGMGAIAPPVIASFASYAAGTVEATQAAKDLAAAQSAARASSARALADYAGVRPANGPTGAASSFASYAAGTVEATRATKDLESAQSAARASSARALADYAGLIKAQDQVAAAPDKKVTDLILKVQGQAEADDLRGKVQNLRQQMVALGPGVSANDPRMQALGREMKAAGDKADKLDKQFGKNRNGMAGFGQSMLQTGRIVQDFTQGGIGGILNNLEGMTQALGGGPGLAGLLTVVGVAAFIARPLLAKMFETGDLLKFKDEFQGLQERIKELADKPIKMPVDRIELAAAEADMNRLVRAAEAYNAARGLKSKAERESESAVNEAIGEDGDVPNAIRKSIATRLQEQSPELRKNREQQEKAKKDIAESQARLKNKRLGGEERRLEEELLKGSTGQLQNLETEAAGIIAEIWKVGDKPENFGKAQSEAGKLLDPGRPGAVGAQQARLADELDRAGKGALASRIRGLSPQDMKEQEQSKDSADAKYKAAKAREDEAKKAEQEQKERESRAEMMAADEVRTDLGNERDIEKDRAAAEREAERAQKDRDRAARALKVGKMSPAQRKAFLRRENLARANAPVPGRDDMDYDPTAPVPGRAGFAGAEMPGVAGAVPGGEGGMSKADVEKMLSYLGTIAGNTDDLGDLGGFQ